MFALKPDAPTPLVSQIVDGFRRLIADRSLKPGTKLPSIRAFAASHGVSVFTVVEAYDRLVAQGWLVSRANAGFFVKRRPDDPPSGPAEPPAPDLRFDARWYLKQILDRKSTRLNSSHANISYAVLCLKKKMSFRLVSPNHRATYRRHIHGI